MSLVLSDLLFAKIGVPEFDRNMLVVRKINMTQCEYFLSSYLNNNYRNPYAIA